MKYTLEAYRIFPFIAWFLVIGFALFTYALTVRVQHEVSTINAGAEQQNAKVDGISVPRGTRSL